MSFAKLDALCRSLEALEHAQSILGADEATHMAVGGGEKRAEAMATLAGMYHRQATAPEIRDWIEAAKAENLSDAQEVSLAEFERRYVNMTCLPSEFVERQTAARMRCEQMWRVLRARNDWEGFLPALEGVVALAREEAAMRAAALGLSPYDAMVDQYDPGLREAAIQPVFDRLKQFLRGFIDEALEVQAERDSSRAPRPLSGTYPVEKQRELGMAMMGAVGFDFTHGSLSVSHHPFCGGVPTDVRMTTRYRTTEFLSSLMGVLHETGHALYEMGIDEAYASSVLDTGTSAGVHESQSRLWENLVGRSRLFWEHSYPALQAVFPEQLADVDLDSFYRAINRVQPSLIRVDADEVTYNLHVIVRFGLELDLLEGKLSVEELPEAWHARYQENLGVRASDDRDGVMQDVHWFSGPIGGSFQGYTLGNIMASQFYAAALAAQPQIEAEIAQGSFGTLHGWLRENLYRHGARYTPDELLRRVTGNELTIQPYLAYLHRKYSQLYGTLPAVP